MSDMNRQELKDIKFMKLALRKANIAKNILEVPIGAIIVDENFNIIASGYNTKEKTKNTLNHAEMIAIKKASKNLNNWRLENCTLYTTLEPCPMCMGAIINSRIKRVVYGAKDKKAGACGSKLNLNEFNLNHKVEITENILEDECSKILSDFFKRLRDDKK